MVQDLGQREAPWSVGDAPFVVAAVVDGDRAVLTGPDGRPVYLDAARFARLVAADPTLAEWPAGAPVVLAVEFAGRGGQEFARAVAAATGRVVYAPTGAVHVQAEVDGGWSYALQTPYLAPDGSAPPLDRFARIDPPSGDAGDGVPVPGRPRTASPGDSPVPVAEPPGAPFTVRFAPGDTVVGEAAARKVYELAAGLAPELARRLRDGLPMPAITITGRGNGMFSADARALDRAVSTGRVLASGLSYHLARLDALFDVQPLIEVVDAAGSEPPPGVLPGEAMDVRLRSASIAVEYPAGPHEQPAPTSAVTPTPAEHAAPSVTRIPAGGWIGEDAHPQASAGHVREALQLLPPRQDTFVLAMHIGDDGAPITPHELGAALISVYERGGLDGR
ncbi:hypothetical protein AB0K51_34860, partial [Kitasatospora sp. NPDC049285]|uniref:hypothetical protein n=1 Tax=Kitasatospora sp. NPDC049285 TaxID=3157096 RepID=UPI00341827EA